MPTNVMTEAHRLTRESQIARGRWGYRRTLQRNLERAHREAQAKPAPRRKSALRQRLARWS